jgi:hypothetical protein
MPLDHMAEPKPAANSVRPNYVRPMNHFAQKWCKSLGPVSGEMLGNMDNALISVVFVRWHKKC